MNLFLPTLRCRAASGLLVLGLFRLATAQAALFEDDEARKAILDLRQKVELTQQANVDELRKAHDENAQLRRSMLELSNQIEVVRAELARMRGQGEQLARDLADVQRQQKDAAQGVEERLKKFEPAKVSVDGLNFLADPLESREFDAALAAMRTGDFAQAQVAFSDFLRRYPGSGYKSSALFWLGNAQYAQKNYREAVLNFRSLVSASPEHSRAPEALLAVANCQLELKDAKAARKTYEELIKSYPQSEAAAVGKDRLTKLK